MRRQCASSAECRRGAGAENGLAVACGQRPCQVAGPKVMGADSFEETGVDQANNGGTIEAVLFSVDGSKDPVGLGGPAQ